MDYHNGGIHSTFIATMADQSMQEQEQGCTADPQLAPTLYTAWVEGGGGGQGSGVL